MRIHHRASLQTLALVAVLALAAQGQLAAAANPQLEQKKVVEAWFERLREIDEDLQAAKWSKAKRATDDLLEEMKKRIEGGAGSGRLLATVSFFRCLAEAGLGEDHRAAWDFRVAQALHPDFAKVDLNRYGAVASRLEPHRLSGKPPADKSPAAEDPSFEPPRRLKTPTPKFPYAKLDACVSGQVVIDLVIDRSGRVRDPTVVAAGDPVLAFAALNAMRDWEFRPAHLAGKPVFSKYTQTFNFKVQACQNDFRRIDK